MAAATDNKKTPTITVLGSLNIDLVSYVSHHPLPGETMTSTRFAVTPGGKGANQAVACAKLSRPRHPPSTSTSTFIDAGTHRHAAAHETAHVRMVGCAGDAGSGTDGYGDLLVTSLRSQGVDTSGVRRPAGWKTGIAVIVVDEPTGQNRIILSPEANHFLQPEHFDHDGGDGGENGWSLSQELFAPDNRPDLLIMQLEIPVPTVLRALRAAREAGIPVLLNPAPAVPLPPEAYAGLAHLVVNETEAAILGSSSDGESAVTEADLETEAGLEAIARRFVARGVRTVVITLGGRGVYYMNSASGDGKGEGGGGKVDKGLVPAEKAKVVDTTAAGDTFVGVYALEVVLASSRGVAFDVGAAVRKANHAAAKTVERPGAQDSIPWRDELDG
ncbi:putative ribokinase [Diatrype stigma]|uniref:Ribokinase n=1 Tax=Diatrype stigma TaxID=117547 RepID=A0AAN9UMI6_9PEZI